ncbi:Putative E3 ubiquitin-protein ligase RING1 [Zea mays]|uniref:Putative E3 ubiquitin-protein ligase RING1a n=2 Tax=Zea mays TaxID=4577 RepID=B4G121_MAIZE|nr:Putative E3 ubiquitin-protein ligase RING1 [Zea mays]ACF88064.1 unknown [Zea mays]ACG29329.1 ribosomal protein L11 methyltransferase containing protein [Zea mays]AQK94575.1 Putative E3 ubiquitin-protein ligase RING1a [Zea mays]AQK94578.1 Putative E3 ubiquitin-protein ligase RING1a [Zea mays]|eukprot:NP_001147987.1 ribosomal protein L11 methyltransferase containing protein [Zea mays]
MPAQKRPLPSSASPGSDADVEEAPGADADGCGGADQRSPKVTLNGVEERDGGPLQAKDQRHDSDADDEEEGDREGGGGGDGSGSGGDDDCDSQSSQSDGVMDEFTLVKLVDVRKEVQCPICLGIIRKTRTVMECLHRFCRDCIDKSMRLGNNECPACRTHCASRRSLRDDPNYDALILALYPDIDKYEEEELAFSEEERTRNKRIQESIAETFRRQTEALVKKRSTVKATDAASTRKTRRNMRPRRRGRISSPDIAPTDFDDDDREENGDDGSKESSSVDDHSPDVRPKRSRRWPMPRRSPAKAIGNTDNSIEDNDDSGGARDFMTASPLRGEMLAWGKNGTRSQTRHGNSSGSSGRMGRSGRVAKLVDQFRNADDFDNELNLYLVLLPLDGQSVPKLEKPYLSCLPTLSVRHLCQFVALQLSRQPKEVEIYIRKSKDACLSANYTCKYETKPEQPNGLERLWEEKSLSDLYPSLATRQGDLELLYSLKAQGQG